MGPSLTLAMADPTNVFAIDDVKFMTNLNVEPVIASETSIHAAIGKYYSGSTQIDIFDAAFAVEAEKIGTRNGKNGHAKRGGDTKGADRLSDSDLDVSLESFEFDQHGDPEEFESSRTTRRSILRRGAGERGRTSFDSSMFCSSMLFAAAHRIFTSSRTKRIFEFGFVSTAFSMT